MLRSGLCLPWGGDKASVTQHPAEKASLEYGQLLQAWLSPNCCPQAPGLILLRGAGRWHTGQSVNLHLTVCSLSPAWPGGLCTGHRPSWGPSLCALGRVVAQVLLWPLERIRPAQPHVLFWALQGWGGPFSRTSTFIKI